MGRSIIELLTISQDKQRLKEQLLSSLEIISKDALLQTLKDITAQLAFGLMTFANVEVFYSVLVASDNFKQLQWLPGPAVDNKFTKSPDFAEVKKITLVESNTLFNLEKKLVSQPLPEIKELTEAQKQDNRLLEAYDIFLCQFIERILQRVKPENLLRMAVLLNNFKTMPEKGSSLEREKIITQTHCVNQAVFFQQGELTKPVKEIIDLIIKTILNGLPTTISSDLAFEWLSGLTQMNCRPLFLSLLLKADLTDPDLNRFVNRILTDSVADDGPFLDAAALKAEVKKRLLAYEEVKKPASTSATCASVNEPLVALGSIENTLVKPSVPVTFFGSVKKFFNGK